MSGAGIGGECIHLFEKYSERPAQKSDSVPMMTVGPLSGIQSRDVVKLEDNNRFMS